jgi:DNA-3-methyladenine glycosylase
VARPFGVPAGQLAPLPRSFFARPSPEVAPDLLGRLLVRHAGGETLVARIVETEAYEEGDPASHSYRGRTPRTEVMFGPPGHLYVYFTYGMHHCMNVVTGKDGAGSAVLLRAAEPIRGLDAMRHRRGVEVPDRLLAGPARLTQALDVDRTLNGVDLVAGPDLVVARGRPVERDRVVVGRRVGIRVGLDRPWRFAVRGSRFVSSPRP